MIDKEGLVRDLKQIGFKVKENNDIIVAFKKDYYIEGGKVWVDDHEMIVVPKNYGFQMKPKRHNLIFFPIS